MFRHSCEVCHFANTSRPSDITIADFWGWQKVDKDFNKDDKGVSLVFINSLKGKRFFEKVATSVNTIKTKLQYALQPNLQSPSIPNPKRMEFEMDYTRKGIIYIAKKYGNIGFTCRLMQKYPIIAKIVWNVNNRIIKKLWKRRK